MKRDCSENHILYASYNICNQKGNIKMFYFFYVQILAVLMTFPFRKTYTFTINDFSWKRVGYIQFSNTKRWKLSIKAPQFKYVQSVCLACGRLTVGIQVAIVINLLNRYCLLRSRTLDNRCVWQVLGDDHYKRMSFVTMSHESTLTVQISCAPSTGINLQPFHCQKKTCLRRT